MGSEPRIVVVGGVAAGMSAASQAKRREPGTHVVVFERGAHISYGACGLPYNLADPSTSVDDLVVLTPQEARDRRGIVLRLRSDVTRIDIESEWVVARDHETGRETREPFDALVLATGARPIRPPLPGMDLPGVETLRDLEDGRRIKALLATQPKQAVVIGGGYIGMEMAHTLRERGLAVTVLEKLTEILPGWVPLGTTANKQGKVAGANAVGGNVRFAGIVATSGFEVFDLEVVRAGLTSDRARDEGLDPVSVVIRHPSRAHSYPGGSPVQVKLIADRASGRLVGGEIVGREGAAMRINVLATVLAGRMSVADLQDLDLVYAPPFAPVWDPLLVAANQLVKKVAS